MRVALLYFTGTGNTEFAAREFAAAFGPGHPVELVNIERLERPPGAGWFEQRDIVGFGAPVYAYNEPRLFRDFLHSLPRVNDRPAFLFLVAGQDAKAALTRPAAVLRGRGFDVRVALNLYLPGNVGIYHFHDGEISFRFMGAHKELDRDGQLADCRVRVARAAALLLAGGRRDEPPGTWERLVTWSLRGVLHGLVGPLTALCLKATDACNGCGLCVETCPCGCIELRDGRPRVGPTCTACVRCLNVCPQHAIRSRWPLGLFNRGEQYLAPGFVPPRRR